MRLAIHGLLAGTLMLSYAVSADGSGGAISRTPAISAGVSGAGSAIPEVMPDSFKLSRARFAAEPASPAARYVADWVMASGDNQRSPFVIIDKIDAKVFVFNASGDLQRAAPALLGLAERDEDEPGVGALPMSDIHPEIRITPAGRFVAQMGHNLKGDDILWVDFSAGLSLHRVATGNQTERRQERLDSKTISDNRISYGCINVPVRFFDEVVKPTFAESSGIVYILPETRSVAAVFGSYHSGGF